MQADSDSDAIDGLAAGQDAAVEWLQANGPHDNLDTALSYAMVETTVGMDNDYGEVERAGRSDNSSLGIGCGMSLGDAATGPAAIEAAAQIEAGTLAAAAAVDS